MTILKRMLICFLLLIAPHIAHADPVIKVMGPDPKQAITFSRTESVYEGDELVSLDQTITIHLDRVPESIKMRELYQGAVGEDGPWADVPGTERAGDWAPLEAKQDLTIKLDEEGGKEKRTTDPWPKTFDCKKAEISDCERWQKIYAKCQNDNSPCYVYRFALELNIRYKGGRTPEKMILKFPGGC